MSAPLLPLLIQARRAGVTLARDGDQLVINRPRSATPLARTIGERKLEVFEVLDVYTGVVAVLDWRAASWTAPAACRACRMPARLRDPYDKEPWHKTCAERLLRTPAPSINAEAMTADQDATRRPSTKELTRANDPT